jgi:5-formyltetrahydrofolate cyclo-ligase
MPSAKQVLREEIWRAMTVNRVARFPGARGRIPNFAGAEAAARHLTTLDSWLAARTIKSNPDAPQRPVRYAALAAGKVVYLAVPRLRTPEPFIELDPRVLDNTKLWQASSIRGGSELGRPVALEDMSHIDLIVAGSVAVGRDGARLGKGGGYSDLEYALCREAGLLDEEVPIVTTVHPLQIVAEGEIEMTMHDISLNRIVTPQGTMTVDGRYPRPPGVLWDELGEKLDGIPVLQALAARRLR